MATEMVAGLALDAEVSRVVFGVTLPDIRPGISASWMEGDAVRQWPHYSTKIEDAWRVFVWLVERYGWAEVYMENDETGCEIHVSEYGYVKRHGGRADPDRVDRLLSGEAFADAPLAICRAALQAMAECERARTKGRNNASEL